MVHRKEEKEIEGKKRRRKNRQEKEKVCMNGITKRSCLPDGGNLGSEVELKVARFAFASPTNMF